MMLVIDHSFLEILGADINTQFEVTTDGKSLILTPVKNGARRAKFNAAVEKVGKKYGKTFEEIAK